MRTLFQATAERLLSDHVTPDLRISAENGVWSQGLWNEIENSGLTLALVSEANGGADATWQDAFPIAVAAGKSAAPVPLVETMLANHVLDIAGHEPLEGTATIAPDLLMLDGDLVSGQLHNVAWARDAAHLIALAGSGANLKIALISLSDCELAPPPLNVAREPRDTITLKGVKPRALLDAPQGFGQNALMLGGAVMRAAQIAGALDTITNMSSQYVTERVQFGRPISKFQAIQQQLALLAEQAALTYTATDQAFAKAPFDEKSLSVSTAKTIASDAAGEGARIAHAAHGAIGFTYEHALHFYTRRLWSWRSEFGSTSYWARQIGQNAFKGGASKMWPAITSNSWA